MRSLAAIAALAVLALASTAPGLGPPSVGPQIRVDVNGGNKAANETTISVGEANPDCIVAAWNDWRRSTSQEIINMGVALSLDGGETWDDFLVRPPVGFQTNVEGDPMTAYDDRTGALWVAAIAFSTGGVYVARKDPGADEFNPAVMADPGGGSDKCWMAAGPRPGDPDTTRVYIAYNKGVIWSDDMGDTWTNPVSLGGGIGFLPRVASDGTVYVSYWDFGDGVLLKRSTNGGQTFTTHRIATRMDVWGTQDGSRFPGNFRVPSLSYMDVDRNDPTKLYAAWFDTTNIVNGQRNVDVYFATSGDRGSTWTTPTVINDDANPPGDQFFCWIESDPQDRLHLLFMDSRNVVQNDGVTNGMFDNYYSYSEDGGQTWTEFRLTPNSYNGNDDGLNRGQQFLGDYLGLSTAGNRAYPCYLDTSNGDPDIYVNVVTFGTRADIDGDGDVDFDDVLRLLAAWGAVPNCPPTIPEDVDEDCDVDFDDLLIVLAEWTG